MYADYLISVILMKPFGHKISCYITEINQIPNQRACFFTSENQNSSSASSLQYTICSFAFATYFYHEEITHDDNYPAECMRNENWASKGRQCETCKRRWRKEKLVSSKNLGSSPPIIRTRRIYYSRLKSSNEFMQVNNDTVSLILTKIPILFTTITYPNSNFRYASTASSFNFQKFHRYVCPLTQHQH